MDAVPARQRPRVEATAWLALALSMPAALLLLAQVLVVVNWVMDKFLDKLGPHRESMRATLVSVHVEQTMRMVLGLCSLGAVAALAFGIQAIRSGRERPSARNTRVASTAIAIALLFFALAFSYFYGSIALTKLPNVCPPSALFWS